MTLEERIKIALFCAHQYGQIDGAHHRLWVIDQMVRALTDCPHEVIEEFGDGIKICEFGKSEEYLEFVREHNDGEDGPNTYTWDEGIPP